MATFQYNAKTREGEERKGTVDAPSLEAAIDALQRNNLIILGVDPVQEKTSFFSGGKFNFGFFNRVSQKDVVILSRQLSTLFEAKVPVVQALKTLVTESSGVALKEAMVGVLDDVNGGSSLSAAMAKHPAVFSAFYINMVRSGEESGKLQEVFTYLADYLERSYALTSRARNAMIYPAFVFSSFIGVVVVMLVVVIPKLTSIFEETGQTVPLYTQVVISASNFLRVWGWLILLLLFFVALQPDTRGQENFSYTPAPNSDFREFVQKNLSGAHDRQFGDFDYVGHSDSARLANHIGCCRQYALSRGHS